MPEEPPYANKTTQKNIAFFGPNWRPPGPATLHYSTQTKHHTYNVCVRVCVVRVGIHAVREKKPSNRPGGGRDLLRYQMLVNLSPID